MRLFIALASSIIFFSKLNAQVQLSQFQTFQWDSAFFEQSSTYSLPSGEFPRLEAHENGFVISSKRWQSLLDQRLWREFHFFNPSMEYDTTIVQGIAYDNFTYGEGEDLFSINNRVYSFGYYRACEVNDSTCNFNVFSCFTPEGILLFSDTLSRSNFMPLYDGSFFGERTKFRIINNDYVYYLSNNPQGIGLPSEVNLIKCNLNVPEIEVFPISDAFNSTVTSFYNANESSIKLERRFVGVDGTVYFSIDSFTTSGSFVSSVLVEEFQNSMVSVGAFDYLYDLDSLLVLYRFNSSTDERSVEFLNENLTVDTSIYLHGDGVDGSPFFQISGSSSAYIVLTPGGAVPPEYRLIEIDLVSRSIINDTIYPFPSDFNADVSEKFFFNESTGEILIYGFSLNNGLPYINRINLLEKKINFDRIYFPSDSTFSLCDYFQIDAFGNDYYVIGVDNISEGVGLNGYCFGKLDFPTSLPAKLNEQFQFCVHPNPTKSNLVLSQLPKEELIIQMLDLQGRVIHTQASNYQTTTQLNTEKLNTGVYFISVHGKKGIQTIKFIKN